MARFDYDGDTLRLQHLGQRESNLLGEALLDLESTREHLGNTGKFRETDDAAVRDVADVHLLKSAKNYYVS
jgi:hypothetical protein